MKTKAMELVWINVKDLKTAVEFYTNVVGLKLLSVTEEYGWAELIGHEGGARIGIAQINEKIAPAVQNAVMTFVVEDLDKALEEMKQKGAKFLGEVLEVPGHVRMQTLQDAEGNQFQMVQKYY